MACVGRHSYLLVAGAILVIASLQVIYQGTSGDGREQSVLLTIAVGGIRPPQTTTVFLNDSRLGELNDEIRINFTVAEGSVVKVSFNRTVDFPSNIRPWEWSGWNINSTSVPPSEIIEAACDETLCWITLRIEGDTLLTINYNTVMDLPILSHPLLYLLVLGLFTTHLLSCCANTGRAKCEPSDSKSSS